MFLLISRLKLEIAQIKDVFNGFDFSCIAHVFKCKTALRLCGFLLRGREFRWSDSLCLTKFVETFIKILMLCIFQEKRKEYVFQVFVKGVRKAFMMERKAF